MSCVRTTRVCGARTLLTPTALRPRACLRRFERISLRKATSRVWIRQRRPSLRSIRPSRAKPLLFLQLLTDFMGEAGNVARINYNAMTATLGRGRAPVANPCVCRKVKGFGDLRPLSVVDELPE